MRDIRRASRVRAGLLALGLLVLAGCQTGVPGGQTGLAVTGAGSGALAVTGAPDPALVRAPELFSASGMALWDGNRTARGIWAAHPRAGSPRRVRMVRGDTGEAIDGMLYPTDRERGGDVVTLSSDAARALGLEPGVSTRVALFGLRPEGVASPDERRRAVQTAEGELAAKVLRLEDNHLLQLVAATMRAMGYATVYEPGPPGQPLSAIRAFPRPDAGFELPSVRVIVRPPRAGVAGAREVAAVGDWLEGSGDLGLLVSPGGFDAAAPAPSGLNLVDLAGLLHIWQARYAGMSDPDRALLPLEPVYFLAGS